VTALQKRGQVMDAVFRKTALSGTSTTRLRYKMDSPKDPQKPGKMLYR
jgi:hypothetical protein